MCLQRNYLCICTECAHTCSFVHEERQLLSSEMEVFLHLPLPSDTSVSSQCSMSASQRKSLFSSSVAFSPSNTPPFDTLPARNRQKLLCDMKPWMPCQELSCAACPPDVPHLPHIQLPQTPQQQGWSQEFPLEPPFSLVPTPNLP